MVRSWCLVFMGVVHVVCVALCVFVGAFGCLGFIADLIGLCGIECAGLSFDTCALFWFGCCYVCEFAY